MQLIENKINIIIPFAFMSIVANGAVQLSIGLRLI